ncbi:MAG: metallophosphoesterase family protein [Candidatus Latescibacterota bacterium]|jgi:predicted phosphodiesterase
MRLGLLSDIHANLEALEATLEEGAQIGIEAWVCLGDTVGYGADPSACLEKVKNNCAVVLLGNHDAAAIGLIDFSFFNPTARRAAEWTAEQLSATERHYLASLPMVHISDAAHFVHAEPSRPQAWGYITNIWDASEALAATTADHCFVGHSHTAFICGLSDGIPRLCTSQIGRVTQREGRRYLTNVGSVGQPRDGDWRACFAVWDQEQGALELVRCSYDLERTQKKYATPAYLSFSPRVWPTAGNLYFAALYP